MTDGDADTRPSRPWQDTASGDAAGVGSAGRLYAGGEVGSARGGGVWPLVSGYALSGSRVVSWGLVSAMVYRGSGGEEFGKLSLARGLCGVVGMVGLAVGPVVLRRLVEVRWGGEAGSGKRLESRRGGADVERQSALDGRENVLVVDDDGRNTADLTGERVARGAGRWLLLAGGLPALVGVLVAGGGDVQRVVVLFMAVGMLMRSMGELSGAVLQSNGRVAKDNLMLCAAELFWPVSLGLLWLGSKTVGGSAEAAAFCAMLAMGLGLAWRFIVASGIVGGRKGTMSEGAPETEEYKKLLPREIRLLASGAALLLVGQLADFLYAPVNQLLLGRAGRVGELAAYAPALQVDAALLLLVGAVGAVMLPQVTRQLAQGEVAAVRRAYVRATLACGAVLGIAGAAVGVAAGPILRAWLGGKVEPATVDVVRLVLVHTVIGGTAGVARAVLLGAGAYRGYALTAVGFGLANAAGAWAVLEWTQWGVRGVVGVTIATVGVRCLVFLPWYTLRRLARLESAGNAG